MRRDSRVGSSSLGKKLVIVESPAKARSIGKYLGKDYDVIASMGHIRDLAKKNGIVRLPGGGFATHYLPIKKKAEVIEKIREKAGKADVIYLAPDPDREGEAIAWHLAREIESAPAFLRKKGKPGKKLPPIHRVVYHEITPKAVRAAIDAPIEIDSAKVEAREARRILDRIVGFDTSELLWEKVKRGLSAGRVQTVALRLLVEREREIKAFLPVEYWSIVARLEKDGVTFDAALHERRVGDSWKRVEMTDEPSAKKILDDLEGRALVVAEVTPRERRRKAPPPFITSTLQQEAARRLRLPVAETMRIAQRLYEGIEMGEEGPVGLITYMRTDSVRLANEAIVEAREVIKKRYGADHLPETPNVYKSRKSAQEAHEAIRPTSFLRSPSKVAKFLPRKEAMLYRLIWQRALSSQMGPAVYDTLRVDIESEPKGSRGEYRFRSTGSHLKFPGFLAAWEDAPRDAPVAKTAEKKEDESEEEGEEESALPPLAVGDRPTLKKYIPAQHFTEPPPRFAEGTLVKELERLGIGRPSTYASILLTLKTRNYCMSDRGRLHPTDLGSVVVDLLIPAFPKVFDVAFTAEMEDEFDLIEEKKMTAKKVLTHFDKTFRKELKSAVKTVSNFKIGMSTDEKCPTCGSGMLLRWGRHGRFLACSRYPDCKTTFEVEVDGEIIKKIERPVFDVVCSKCGKAMEFKASRFGAFLGCVDYPVCKGTRPLRRIAERAWVLEEVPDVKDPCPICAGKMEVKRSRFGRFFACQKYPDCKGTLPFMTDHGCPECGKGRLAERTGRGGVYHACTAFPDCKFRSQGVPIAEKCPACGASVTFRRTGKTGTRRVCGKKSCGHILLEEDGAEGVV